MIKTNLNQNKTVGTSICLLLALLKFLHAYDDNTNVPVITSPGLPLSFEKDKLKNKSWILPVCVHVLVLSSLCSPWSLVFSLPPLTETFTEINLYMWQFLWTYVNSGWIYFLLTDFVNWYICETFNYTCTTVQCINLESRTSLSFKTNATLKSCSWVLRSNCSRLEHHL